MKKHIQFSYFPGGKPRALTMSYDDGVVADRHLIQIFNTYGIRGTFHLNGVRIANSTPEEGYFVLPEEVKSLYAGHEVSGHLATHPWASALPLQTLQWEITEERLQLEKLTGYPTVGISYPYGDSTAEIRALLPKLGVHYARTIQSVPSMRIPEDFLLWNPTCHHNGNLFELGDAFLHAAFFAPQRLMYVWGHAYEFDNDHNWDRIEKFCDQMAGHDDVWYATNAEIWEYDCAQKRLIIAADESVVRNPSAVDVWVGVGDTPGELGDPVCIPAGQTVRI